MYDNTEKDSELSWQYKEYVDKMEGHQKRLWRIPCYESILESKRILLEIQRQLELQLSTSQDTITKLGVTNPEFSDYIAFGLEPKDRKTMDKILGYMDKGTIDKVVNILNIDKNNKFDLTELNDIFDENEGWEKYAAMCIENGIKADALKNIHDIATVANDIIGLYHSRDEYGWETADAARDKYCKENLEFFENFGNTTKLSNTEPIEKIIKTLPKFKYGWVAPALLQDIWKRKEADCAEYTLITTAIMKLAGRSDVYIVYGQFLESNSGHVISLLNDNNEFRLFDSLNVAANGKLSLLDVDLKTFEKLSEKDRTKDVYQVYDSFLDGAYIAFDIDENGAIKKRHIIS